MSSNVVVEPEFSVEENRPMVTDGDVETVDDASRDAIPELPRGQEIFTRAFAAVAWLYGLYWIIWRWGWSLNPHAMVFSVVLVVAETFGLITYFFLISTVWRLMYRMSSPAHKGLSV